MIITKKMFRLFLIILVPLMLSNRVYAQNASIKGVVRDTLANLPVMGAEVRLQPGNHLIATNSDGEFIFKNLKAGSYIISVSHLSFKKLKKQVIMHDTGTLKFIFQLVKTTINLPEMLVIGRVNIPFTLTKSSINKIEIEATASRDIGDYLRKVPNISGIRRGGSAVDIEIRGFRFDQLNIRLDGGIRVEGGCPNRMDPTAAHVEMEDIDKIEIINGPYALKFGPAFGAYVALSRQKPVPMHSAMFEIHAKVLKAYESNNNGEKEHLVIHGGNDKLYFHISGGKKDFGNYKAGDGNYIKSAFHKYSLLTELAYSPSGKHEILGSYYYSRAYNTYFPALRMDERNDETQIMYLEYTGKKLTKKVNMVKFRVYRSDVDHLMDNKERPDADTMSSSSHVDAIVDGVAASTLLRTGKKSTLLMGLGFEKTFKNGIRNVTLYMQPPNIQGNIPVRTDMIMNAEINNAGIFGEYKNKFGKMDFLAALRLDYNFAASKDTMKIIKNNIHYFDNYKSEYLNFSFSFGIERPIIKNLTLGFALGHGVRSPNMLERYIKFLPIGWEDFDYLGNPQIKPEANNQVDLSLKYIIAKAGTFQINGFYSYIDNYISSKVLSKTVAMPKSKGVIGVKWFYNEDYAIMRGFEFIYNSPDQYKWGAQVTASYTRGTISTGAGYTSNEMGQVTDFKEVQHDALWEIPPFEGNMTIHYKCWNNKFIPRGSLRLVASQNYVSEAMQEKATPGFFVIDFGFMFKYNSILSMSGGINNIADKLYYEHLNRRILGSTQKLYEPGRVFYINLFVNI